MGIGQRQGARVLRALLESYQQSERVDLEWSNPRGSILGRMLAQAQVPLSTFRRWIAITLSTSAVGFCVLEFRMAAVLLVIGISFMFLRLWRKAQAHRWAIDRDLPALLMSIASSVRAGIDPLSALISARDYFPKETILVREVEKVRERLSQGEDEEEVIERFLAVYASQEGELFKRCLILSRRHGSSLAEPLHRITRVVRQRQSFRRKVKAALAMHRMSAIGIALCAVAMGALQYGMNPHAVELATHHPVGSKLLMAGVGLIVTGVVWMMMMGREAGAR